MNYEKFQSRLTGEPVAWDTQGWGVLGVDAAGSLSGAVIVEGTVDGETWTPLTSDAGAAQVTSEGHQRYDVSGYVTVRFRPDDGTTVDMDLHGVAEG